MSIDTQQQSESQEVSANHAGQPLAEVREAPSGEPQQAPSAASGEQVAEPIRIPAGSSWVIRDDADKHRTKYTTGSQPDVIQGDEAMFRLADERLGCLCHGIPDARMVEGHFIVGQNWSVLLLWKDNCVGLYKVTTRVDC